MVKLLDQEETEPVVRGTLKWVLSLSLVSFIFGGFKCQNKISDRFPNLEYLKMLFRETILFHEV